MGTGWDQPAPTGAKDPFWLGASLHGVLFRPHGACVTSTRPMACAMGYFLTPLPGLIVHAAAALAYAYVRIPAVLQSNRAIVLFYVARPNR